MGGYASESTGSPAVHALPSAWGNILQVLHIRGLGGTEHPVAQQVSTNPFKRVLGGTFVLQLHDSARVTLCDHGIAWNVAAVLLLRQAPNA